MEMLTFCLQTAYFQLDSDNTDKVGSLAIAFPIFPVINLYMMEYFEEMTIETSQLASTINMQTMN